MFVFMDQVVRSITVEDTGEGPGSPLFLDKTEARRKIFSRPPPLSKGLDDRPPLSKGLDPALNKLVFEGQLQKIPNRGDM